jgi:Cu/Zn superoxide dismutase
MLKGLIFSIILSIVLCQTAGICIFTGTTTNPGTTGTLYFDFDPVMNQTNITGTILGLLPNRYMGLHVHIKGDISALDGTASGLHYNPFTQNHALLNVTLRRM